MKKYADAVSMAAMARNIKSGFASIKLCEDLASALELMGAVAGASARVAGLTPEDLDFVLGWDASLTNIDSMWENDESIDILPPIDVSNVTSARLAFAGSALRGWKGYLDLSKCADLSYAMRECGMLYNIDNDGIVWPKVPCSYQFMFQRDADLAQVPGTVSNASNVQGMFMSCETLTKAPVFKSDKARCAGLNYMYYHCYKLKTAYVPDTGTVTTYERCFENCGELTRVVGELHFSSTTTYDYMFYGCPKLAQVEIRLARQTGSWAGYDLSDLSAWGDDSIIGGTAASTSLKNSIEALPAPASGGVVSNNTLKLHSNLASRITNAQIAAAANKYWTITFS